SGAAPRWRTGALLAAGRRRPLGQPRRLVPPRAAAGRPLLGRATARSRLWRSSFAVLATASLPGGVPGQPSSSPRADAASRAVLGRLAQRLPSRPALRAPVRLSLGPGAAGRRGRLQPGGVGVFRAAGAGGPLLRRQPVGPPRLALARLAGL